jgi:hypothetical protein
VHPSHLNHSHPSHSQTSRLLTSSLSFQFPEQPSVCEACRFLSFSFQSFIAPTFRNRFYL